MGTMFDGLRVGDRWELSTADLTSIADRYGLTAYTIGPRPLGGSINGIGRINCGEQAWIVRVHRPWTDPARLAGIHAIQKALRIEGQPIPRILLDTTGATYTQLADRLVEVIEYIPSEGTANDWDSSIRAFGTLGELQAPFARLPTGLLPPPAYSSYVAPETALAMLKETDTTFRALAEVANYQQAVRARIETQELLERLATARRSYESSLSIGYIHGDYGGDNVLLADGRVIAILDFDFMARRERIFDLAYGLYWALDRFCRGDNAEVITATCLDRLNTMLQRYQRAAATPLNSTEVAALPLEMARIPLYWLAEAGYLSESPADTRPLAQTTQFARHIPISRHLIDNADRIGRLFVPG